jgi:Transposase DDE domain.
VSPRDGANKTSHGVIQGYDGIAAVDHKQQIIVQAAAYGAAQEHDWLLPTIAGIADNFTALGETEVFKDVRVTADSGFHTEDNLQALHERKVDAYIADNRMRKRDPRFLDTDKYRARARQEKQQFQGAHRTFSNQDFSYDEKNHTGTCPAGQSLYGNGSPITLGGYHAVKFCAPKRACRPCHLRDHCLRHPERTEVRQVTFFTGQGRHHPYPFTQKMKQKIDSPAGQALYGQRLGTAEPVFGNHRNHGRDRFTLRGEIKVNSQWLLYSIVHNLGKIPVYGEGFT